MPASYKKKLYADNLVSIFTLLGRPDLAPENAADGAAGPWTADLG